MTRTLALATIALLSLTAAAAAEDYVGIYLGSQHFGNDDLNNVNPGLTYGRRWDTARDGVELHLEGGIFYNSYNEVSPIVLAGISTRIAELGPGEIRIGASAGTAYYPTLADDLEEEYGIPNAGGFIPMVAATASWRIDRTEIRITTVPPGTDTMAIVNASIAFAF